LVGGATEKSARGAVKGPWTDRLKLIERALGWPRKLLAKNLGFRDARPVDRIVEGGIPDVETLLKLQAIESLYAEQIEDRRNRNGGPKKAVEFPPDWVECRERWWIGGVKHESAARPADLAALGENRATAETVLRGRYDPRNFPGRSLKIVDWSAAGRARFAKDRQAGPRKRYKIVRVRKADLDGSSTEGPQ
jgi:hypothetical protein